MLQESGVKLRNFTPLIRIFGVQLRNPAMRKFYFLFMLLPALSWSVALRAQRLGIEGGGYASGTADY